MRKMRDSISGNFRRAALASAAIVALATMGMQPAKAQTFTVLYTFTGGADGGTPLATPTLYAGTVYGTSTGGGANAAGTVYGYSVSENREVALHSFNGTDGSAPIAGLTQAASSHNFYGVAYRGGTYNDGTMFMLTPAGVFTLLHNFAGPTTEGIGPAGNLVFDPKGNLYGTTYVGGSQYPKGWGTVYEYSAGGVYTTGQSFPSGGALPRAGMYYTNGALYGTTCGCGSLPYGGSIYQAGVPSALYTFSGGADGSQPMGSLVGDGQGNLYGTTAAGGTGAFGNGYGVVFEFNIASKLLTVVHTFTGPDGGAPESALARDSQGNMYGTTTLGGAHGFGTVFELSSTGTLTTLYNFTGGVDGAKPVAGVALDSNGNLWGATSSGGSAVAPGGYGTLFKITPATSLDERN